MYFDIHTHHFGIVQNVTAIENVSKDFAAIEKGRRVSAGLHPWYVSSQSLQNDFTALMKAAGREEILAIGECGLDRICNTDFALQLMVFENQIQLAEQLRKPLVIHCVKAFSECLHMLQNVTVPVIFHGINNKLSTIRPVMERNYYLSFGKAMLSSNEAIRHAFKETRLHQVFLETDDTGSDIMEIYKMAAHIKNIDEKEIVLQLERNFLTVFGK